MNEALSLLVKNLWSTIQKQGSPLSSLTGYIRNPAVKGRILPFRDIEEQYKNDHIFQHKQSLWARSGDTHLGS